VGDPVERLVIIRALGWTMLDGGIVVEVSISQPDALGVDSDPRQWRTFKGPMPGEVAAGGRADMLAWFGSVLLELAADA